VTVEPKKSQGENKPDRVKVTQDARVYEAQLGIGHIKGLWLRLITANCAPLKNIGMKPVKSFMDKSKYFSPNSIKSPKESGIVDESSLCDKSNLTRACNSLRVFGTPPKRLLPNNSMVVSMNKLPMEDGIDPDNPFFDKSSL